MPSFDVAVVGAPEQLPGCFMNFDLRTAQNEVTLASTNVTAVNNTSPGSLLAKKKNDKILSSWWDASAVGTPTYDPTLYNGFGGVKFTASGQALAIAHADAPTLLAPQNYTFWVLATHAVGTDPAFIFTDTGAANLLQFAIDNPASSHHVTYRGASGPIDTGVAAVSGTNFYALTLDAGAPAVNFYRNSPTPVFTGTNYAGTRFGGLGASAFIGDDGTSGQWLNGNIGHFMMFNRALTQAEVALLMDVVSIRFDQQKFAGVYQHVPTMTNVFLDPAAGDGRPSRINSTDGYPQRYIVAHRGVYSFVDLLVLPLRPGFQDPVDPSAGYVPHFLEWPFQPSKMAPEIYQIAGDPSGVCRLRLRDYGRYCFALYRPGAGMQLVHFNLEP